MENQHRKIAGYRELSEAEIALMNEVKALGLAIEGVVGKVRVHLRDQNAAAHADGEELQRIHLVAPARWASIAETDMQKGLMALTRAVAQPTLF